MYFYISFLLILEYSGGREEDKRRKFMCFTYSMFLREFLKKVTVFFLLLMSDSTALPLDA